MPVEILPGLGRGRGLEIASVLSLRQVILRWDVGVVHSFSFPAHFYAALAARLTGRPSIVNVRNSHHDLVGKLRRFLWRWLISRLATSMVAVSESVAAEMTEITGRRDIVCIPNGVDLTAPNGSHTRWSVRAELGVPRDALVVGTVGNLRPIKGHRYLLQAALAVTRELPSARFLLIGAEEPDTGHTLREYCHDAGLEQHVIFLGRRRDVPRLLPAMDIFCLPSLSEGMSRSLLEAMAAGLPVAATAVGGNREVVLDGETGYLVPPEDPQALARALLSLARDSERRREMGEAARLRVRRHFDVTAMLERYANLYHSLLGSRPAQEAVGPGGEPGHSPAAVLAVIVSYNSIRCLPACLGSLQQQNPLPARVMVVDNASSDGSATAAEAAFPQAEVVRKSRNIGYGAAANQGIGAAMESGLPYVLVLNPDVVLEPGAVVELVAALEACPSAAAAGPKLLESKHASSTLPVSEDEASRPAVRPVTWLHGCVLLLRVEALRQVGVFCPSFFLYGEETDLHDRLQRAGWSLLEVPSARAHHVGGASSKCWLGGARVAYYQVRNAFLFTKRNRWHEGSLRRLQSICGILRWHVTPRRLLHPTRFVALALGFIAGLYLLARAESLAPPGGKCGAARVPTG